MLGLAGIPGIDRFDQLLAHYENIPATSVAVAEDFWEGIRDGYRLKPDYINLENGYYCFLPQETLEKYISHIREVNYQGAYYMRTKSIQDKKEMAIKLAALAGCSTEELVITRNTTEALDIVIAGVHLEAGDEAIGVREALQGRRSGELGRSALGPGGRAVEAGWRYCRRGGILDPRTGEEQSGHRHPQAGVAPA